MREQPSSSSSCSHHWNYDADGHESPPGGQSDIKWDDEANKSMSDHSGGGEFDGNAEESDKVASKTMLKRQTSLAVTRLTVKP